MYDQLLLPTLGEFLTRSLPDTGHLALVAASDTGRVAIPLGSVVTVSYARYRTQPT